MAQPAMISLKIKCLKSDDFDLQIDSEASVDDLKEEIVKIRNIEPTKQRLIYKGRVLKSNKKLKDYSIADQTTVHLIVRKQAVTNPRNDEVNAHNSTNTNNRNPSIPTGTTAISVAVVDGSNGAADVNSILNSVLSGFSSGNLNQQSLQNQIQSAMANNPSHVMNLRGLLNPGDNPNAPNDDDVSSVDGDDATSNTNNTANRLLPELQPQFAVSNGRGGYSPVTLLPPVLRSCNAINIELDRLQRNYNRDVMGIIMDNDNNMNIDGGNDTGMNVDNGNVDVEVQVETIVADGNGNVLSNNESESQPQANSNGNNETRRREYLSTLLDVWDRFNEVVNGQHTMDNINTDTMDEDGDDVEMKKGIEYQGVIGFIESVFDELIDYQNTIETGLNCQDKDDDNDMEMKGNHDDNTLKGYSKERKDGLTKKVKCGGNMLVEIGTVLASLGHMINKMDLHRKTPRNRLRVTGLSGVSHVVRTAVPVEISTIVSRGINMQNIGQQFEQIRQIATQNTPNNAQQSNISNNENNAPSNEVEDENKENEVSNTLSSLLDTFENKNEDNANMDVDDNNNNNSNNNSNPMSALLNVFNNNNSNSNPLASLMSAFNNSNNNSNNSSNNSSNPLMLVQRTLSFLMDTLSVKEIELARNANYSFIGNHRNVLKAFVLNDILSANDSPMRRHEIAMDYANGFGLFMISQFSSERRDVIRSLTLSHFKNNTPVLIDIVLDSYSESVFEERLIEWISSVFSSWIYKLSLKFTNRLDGVKKLFCEILMNSMKYLNRNSNNISAHLPLIPQFIGLFVDGAKSYHLQEMQKQHESQQQRSSSTDRSSSFTNRRNNSNEQWVMNVEESERNRWLETIRCDQKRMKQCLSDMKHHEFSDSYLPPQSLTDKNSKNDKQ